MSASCLERSVHYARIVKCLDNLAVEADAKAIGEFAFDLELIAHEKVMDNFNGVKDYIDQEVDATVEAKMHTMRFEQLLPTFLTGTLPRIVGSATKGVLAGPLKEIVMHADCADMEKLGPMMEWPVGNVIVDLVAKQADLALCVAKLTAQNHQLWMLAKTTSLALEKVMKAPTVTAHLWDGWPSKPEMPKPIWFEPERVESLSVCLVCGTRCDLHPGETLVPCKRCKMPLYCSDQCRKKVGMTHRALCVPHVHWKGP